MPWLGFLEVLAECRVQAIAQAQKLDRVQGALGQPLFHLNSACAALGGSDFDVAVLEPPEQVSPGAERSPELVAAKTVRPTHAGATAIDEFDIQLGDPADQIQSGHANVQRPEMARLMVADPGAQRLVRPGQLAALIEAGKILAQVHRVLGDEFGIQVVGQFDVFLTKHECRSRLGADHGVTVADGVAQNPEVAQGEVTRVIDVADDQAAMPELRWRGGTNTLTSAWCSTATTDSASS